MLETGGEEVESRMKGIGTDGRRRKLMDLKNGGCTDRRWMGALGQQMTGLGISWYFKRDRRAYKEEPDTAWECGITKYHSDFGREVELGASQSTGVGGGAVGDGLCLAAIGRRRLSWTEYKQHPDREWHPFGKPAGHLARAPLLAGCKLTEGGCGSPCRLAMWGEDFCFVKKRKIATG